MDTPENGGKPPVKRRPGRPKGSRNKTAQHAEHIAKLYGQKPEVILMQWAQTGLAEHVKTDTEWFEREEPNKKTGEMKKVWDSRTVPVLGPDGKPELHVVPLSIAERLEAAKISLPYVSAKLTPKPIEQTKAEDEKKQPEFVDPEIAADAARLDELIMRPLPADLQKEAEEELKKRGFLQ